MTPIKICGLTRKEDVRCAVQLKVAALGFVFYAASPRCVTPAQARELMQEMPSGVTAVGLFVNASAEQVQETVAVANVQLLQFHGDETPEQCHAIAELVQKPFMRAVRIKADMSGADLVQCDTLYRAASPWFSAL